MTHTCTRYSLRLVSRYNTNTMSSWFGNPSSFGAPVQPTIPIRRVPAPERTPAVQWPRKPVGAKIDETEVPGVLVAMCIDRSGSMASMGTEVVGGCNAFLDEQRKTDASSGLPTHLIVTTFDNAYEVIRNAPLAEQSDIKQEEIQPRGSTALYDAIGKCLDDATAKANSRTLPYEKIVIFIITDGQENASQTYKKDDITRRIKQLEGEYGWDFYFAAANQDAMVTGGSLGFQQSKCVSYNADNAETCQAAFRCASSKVSATRTGNLANATFSQQEREECMAPAKTQ